MASHELLKFLHSPTSKVDIKFSATQMHTSAVLWCFLLYLILFNEADFYGLTWIENSYPTPTVVENVYQQL